MTKVIAVIVNFNSSGSTLKLISKLQSMPFIYKTIVVDNGSDAKNLHLLQSGIKKLSKATLIANTNQGFAGGVNRAIEKGKALNPTHFLLLNPDLEIDSQLEKLLGYADIVAPVLRFRRKDRTVYDFGGRVNWLLGRPYHLEFNSAAKQPVQIDYVSGACVLIKSEVVSQIGMFDENFFMYFEDVDYCLRATQAGYKIRVNPAVIIDHQISEHKYSTDVKKMRFALSSNRKFIQKWSPPLMKPLALVYLFLLDLKINLLNNRLLNISLFK